MSPCTRAAGTDGQSAPEYLGLLVVIAALVAALGVSPVGDAIGRSVQQAICRIGGVACGGGPGEVAAGQDGSSAAPINAAGRPDADGDGMADADEITVGSDPGQPDASFPLPGAPPPPSAPEDGDGSGPFGSDAASLGDRLTEQAVATAAALAESVKGWTDAARHLRHYLGASGEPLDVDVARILADVESARRVSQTLLQQAVRDHRAAIAAALAGGERMVIPFRTGWELATAQQGDEANWYFALGSFSVAESGTIIVEPSGPGGEPVVRIEHQTHVFDRYNWDQGKSVTIGGVTIYDEQLQELHESGLAQEFDVSGSSSPSMLDLAPDQLDSATLPVPDQSRDGDRSDPGRDRGNDRADRDRGREGRGR